MNARTGKKVALNIYDGDRPVCQCHNPEDAQLIVMAVNLLRVKQDWLDLVSKDDDVNTGLVKLRATVLHFAALVIHNDNIQRGVVVK